MTILDWEERIEGVVHHVEVETDQGIQDIWQGKLSYLKSRARTAMAKLEASPNVVHFAQLNAMLVKAHNQAVQAMKAGVTPLPDELPWELVHGLCTLDLLKDAKSLPKIPAQFQTIVRTDGTLLGCRQWELLDPRWNEAMVEWLEHLVYRAEFGTTPAVLDMPENVVLGIVGDWGTGLFDPDAAAGKIAKLVAALEPDYTIHLGDVYYAGTEEDEENNMKDWPQGTRGSFNLNSNHEMYNGALGYFAELKRKFPLQNNTSYFALQNTNWLVIGLDSVFHADRHNLYMNGNLDQGQIDWIASLPKQGKKVLVLSHHEGYSALGNEKTELYQQVKTALGCDPDYWYWGHLHNGIVYNPIDNFHGRCAGHGAIPYGNAIEMQDKLGALKTLAWFETQLAKDGNYPERVLNGYAVVTLNDKVLTEKMMGEDGSVRWEGTHQREGAVK